MNTTGYGGTILKGSIKSGFTKAKLDNNFANQLSKEAPLPKGCAF